MLIKNSIKLLICTLVPFYLSKIFYTCNYADILIIYIIGVFIGLLLPQIDKINTN